MVPSVLSGRIGQSKEEKAQTCIFLKDLVTSDRTVDMDMLCPSGMKRATTAGCLKHVNMVVAASV